MVSSEGKGEEDSAAVGVGFWRATPRAGLGTASSLAVVLLRTGSEIGRIGDSGLLLLLEKSERGQVSVGEDCNSLPEAQHESEEFPPEAERKQSGEQLLDDRVLSLSEEPLSALEERGESEGEEVGEDEAEAEAWCVRDCTTCWCGT